MPRITPRRLARIVLVLAAALLLASLAVGAQARVGVSVLRSVAPGDSVTTVGGQPAVGGGGIPHPPLRPGR